jgi:myosin-crossreactive antigen
MFEVVDTTYRKIHLVGSGIASLAAAAYLIRDGGIRGEDIVVYEEASQLGGALDAHGSPETGYFMSGSRMFEPGELTENETLQALSFGPVRQNSSLLQRRNE